MHKFLAYNLVYIVINYSVLIYSCKKSCHDYNIMENFFTNFLHLND